jgi:hypothetical protein
VTALAIVLPHTALWTVRLLSGGKSHRAVRSMSRGAKALALCNREIYGALVWSSAPVASCHDCCALEAHVSTSKVKQ